MNDLAFLNQYTNQRILIAPLNWGLGHATRSAAIINKLIPHNEVLIASDGIALDWLRISFPQLESLELPSYGVSYQSSQMVFNIVKGSSKMLRAITREHEQIEEFSKQKDIDLIIADHRFGCYSKVCHSIVVAHQIHIPHRNKLFAKIASKVNRTYLNRYNEVWIPDYPEIEKSIAGPISAPDGLKAYKHIGPLSHLVSPTDNVEKDIDILVLLSGPEPMRTELENTLLDILKRESSRTKVLVRGCRTEYDIKDLRYQSFEQVFDLAQTDQIERLICRSKNIICRSGYSTIMDLERLQQKAILIPTPGQPEQEYLAEYHNKRGYKTLIQSELNSNPQSLSKLLT